MPSRHFRLSCLSGIAAATLFAVAPSVVLAAPATLQEVAHFDHQVTGVTVAKDGRIFVNFPRWTEDTAVSVAEVGKDGRLTPYPDAEWNGWRNAKMASLSPATHFVCVQSVVADGHGNLWVVDPAAPGNDKVVKGGAKLVKIDLASNKVTQTILFDESVAPPSSYLNDVRFSPDGTHAYLTDSGKGALIVVDLESGKARRLLDGDKSTMFEKDVVIKTDGQPLRRPDGRGPLFNADGIALSPKGETLYYQALTGKTLYRVPTAALLNETLKPQDLASMVQEVGEDGPADGLWMDEKANLYVGDMQNNAIKTRQSVSATCFDAKADADCKFKLSKSLHIVIQDDRLRWPDTFSEGPDGAIYVTSSHIQDSPWFKPGAPNTVKTELWKIVPQAK